jgi:hypothetical protein
MSNHSYEKGKENDIKIKNLVLEINSLLKLNMKECHHIVINI